LIPEFEARGLHAFCTKDASIIHQDGELAVGPHRRVYRLLPVNLLCHIKSDKGCLPTLSVDVRRDFLSGFDQDIAEYDFGSFFGEELCLCLALSAGSSRNQRDFASESSSHGSGSFVGLLLISSLIDLPIGSFFSMVQ